jgi:hypothetical protein
LALRVAKKFYPVEFPERLESHTILDPVNTSLALKLATVVKVWADGFRGRVTARVLDGRAEMPEGYELGQSTTRRKLASVDAFKKIALEYVSEEELAKAADYTFTAVETAISEKTVRGKKEATVKEFQQKLVESGAVQPGEPFTFLRNKSEKKKDL